MNDKVVPCGTAVCSLIVAELNSDVEMANDRSLMSALHCDGPLLFTLSQEKSHTSVPFGTKYDNEINGDDAEIMVSLLIEL